MARPQHSPLTISKLPRLRTTFSWLTCLEMYSSFFTACCRKEKQFLRKFSLVALSLLAASFMVPTLISLTATTLGREIWSGGKSCWILSSKTYLITI